MDSEKSPHNYEDLSFEELRNDSEINSLVEQTSLDYIKINDAENFDQEFTGELDSQGYLIRRDGGPPRSKASQLIISDDAKDLILTRVKLDLRNKDI